MTTQAEPPDHQTQQKLRNVFHERYAEGFKDREREWHEHLRSIGCTRSTQFTPNSIECPDSYTRMYTQHWIEVPQELVFRFLVLGVP